MRKWFALIITAAILCGCGVQPTFETVNDDDSLLASASIRQITLDLPKEAAQSVIKSDSADSLYLCNGYTLTVQTLPGGDLNRTMQQISGYGKDQLQFIRTKGMDADRYDLAWASAGEGGDQVARAVILDDGQNHYAVTVMADAQESGQLQKTWNQILGSVSFRTD